VIIEKDIPIPLRYNTRGAFGGSKYQFSKMEIGDSALVSRAGHATARKFSERHPPYKFTSQKQPDGTIRIWRTA